MKPPMLEAVEGPEQEPIVLEPARVGRSFRTAFGLKIIDLGSANGGRFVAMLVASRVLGPESFGQLSEVLVLGMFAGAAGNLGGPTAVARGTALFQQHGLDPFAAVRALTPSRAAISVLAGLLAALFYLADGGAIGRAGVVALVAVAQLAATFLEFAVAGIGLQGVWVRRVVPIREVARWSVLPVLLWVPEIRVALAAELLPLLASAVAGTVLLWRRARRSTPMGTPTPEDVREVQQFAGRIAPSSLLGLGIDWLPPVLVVALGAHTDVAQFMVAWRWMGLVPTLLPLAGVTLVATYARLTPEEKHRFLPETFTLGVGLPLFAAVGMGVCGVILIPRFSGPEYVAAGLVALVLAAGTPARIVAPTYRQVLSFEGRWIATVMGPTLGLAMACAIAIGAVAFRVSTPMAIALGAAVGGQLEVAYYGWALLRTGLRVPILRLLGASCLSVVPVTLRFLFR